MAAVARNMVVSTPRRTLTSVNPTNAELKRVYADLEENTTFDFSEIISAVKTFQQRFRAYTENAISNVNDDKAEFDSNRMEYRNQLRILDREVQDSKTQQRELWDNIAHEREQDANLRARQQALQAQRNSLIQRCTEIQAEIAEMKQRLEARKSVKESQRATVKEQMERNGEQLRLLEAKTGCSVAPTKVGDQLRFTFNLMNANDWAAECFFTIDVRTSQYNIVAHSPQLSAHVMDQLLDDLNSTRKFYTFVKRMRAVLKEEAERRRIEAKSGSKK